MNFRAWRDQIVAERELRQVVDQQIAEHPERKAALVAKVAKWKKARDASCEKSAREEWGEGSMRPTAQAICATASAKQHDKGAFPGCGPQALLITQSSSYPACQK